MNLGGESLNSAPLGGHESQEGGGKDQERPSPIGFISMKHLLRKPCVAEN
jgi:hypothetical protein